MAVSVHPSTTNPEYSYHGLVYCLTFSHVTSVEMSLHVKHTPIL